ncbi:MAG: hypothetical protein COV67_10505 [Nitrospinae bacterium CG11_big_fil_rev_8_21_14_0_20_56_8]|nr:MAG: hypothetical protein COV67_10505 [Nitrospinae bacterium CG11_big_fil_rev_8_21_14_0_20_56_8]
MHILNQIKIFKGLDDDELSSIYHLAIPKRIETGQYLIREDQRGNSLFIILEGLVEVLVENPVKPGETIPLAKLRAHDVLGELSIFDDSPRSASALARSATDVLEIPKVELWKLFEKNNRMGMVTLRNLGATICERLRSADMELRNCNLWLGM